MLFKYQTLLSLRYFWFIFAYLSVASLYAFNILSLSDYHAIFKNVNYPDT
jgi:hypothetical protein